MAMYSYVNMAASQCAAGTDIGKQLWGGLEMLSLMTGTSLFMQLKVHERLWGYNDPLLRAAEFHLALQDGRVRQS